jgi:ABC-type long-subunit fatty acid transport system fused permease/ATPase subunit
MLGVRERWYIPLVLCRALCFSSAIVWALYTALQLFYTAKYSDKYDVLTGQTAIGKDVYHSSYVEHYRLAAVQVALSYLWVSRGLHALLAMLCSDHSPLRARLVSSSNSG